MTESRYSSPELSNLDTQNTQQRTKPTPAVSTHKVELHKNTLPEKSKNEDHRLTTVVVWWRKYCLWFNTVFIRRKEYKPGDTCRFIWQTAPEVKRSFVYYRVGHMIASIFIFSVSFFHILIPYKKRLCENEPVVLCFGPFRLQYEWFFYATSWGITVNLAQSIWAMVLTLQFYQRQKKEKTQDKEKLVSKTLTSSKSKDSPSQTKDLVAVPESRADSATKEHRILSRTGFYWGLHSYSMCSSILIDVVYWTLVWPKISGKISNKFFNELNEHGFNLPLMIGDYCVVAFPVILPHVAFTVSISYLYLFVSSMYYISGGKNEERTERYLYAFLNWETPGIAILFGSLVAIMTSIILLIFLLIDHYKFKYCSRRFSTKSKSLSNRP